MKTGNTGDARATITLVQRRRPAGHWSTDPPRRLTTLDLPMRIIQCVWSSREGRTGPIPDGSAHQAGTSASFCSALRHLRTRFGQRTLAGELGGDQDQGQKLADLVQSAHHRMRQRPHRPAPAKAPLDAPPGAQDHRPARVSFRAPIDGAAAEPVEVVRETWRNVALAACVETGVRCRCQRLSKAAAEARKWLGQSISCAAHCKPAAVVLEGFLRPHCRAISKQQQISAMPRFKSFSSNIIEPLSQK